MTRSGVNNSDMQETFEEPIVHVKFCGGASDREHISRVELWELSCLMSIACTTTYRKAFTQWRRSRGSFNTFLLVGNLI